MARASPAMTAEEQAPSGSTLPGTSRMHHALVWSAAPYLDHARIMRGSGGSGQLHRRRRAARSTARRTARLAAIARGVRYHLRLAVAGVGDLDAAHADTRS